jgi:HAE1 family hydrophobic/amphiphilic exporter-1
VGGLAFSQIITLYVTPVFYTYLDSVQRLLSGRRRPPALVPQPDAPEARKPETAAVG